MKCRSSDKVSFYCILISNVNYTCTSIQMLVLLNWLCYIVDSLDASSNTNNAFPDTEMVSFKFNKYYCIYSIIFTYNMNLLGLYLYIYHFLLVNGCGCNCKVRFCCCAYAYMGSKYVFWYNFWTLLWPRNWVSCYELKYYFIELVCVNIIIFIFYSLVQILFW